MTPDQWEQLVASESAQQTEIIRAVTFLKKWDSYSSPVLLACDNNLSYVVKGLFHGHSLGHSLFSDQITGRLGHLLSAPIPEIALVKVPDELISAESEMDHLKPGVSHGSRYWENYTDRENIKYIKENINNFASLSVLYGWFQANDHQFIYSNTPPHTVLSVDHGHFLPGGPNWTIDTMKNSSMPELDSSIINNCNIPIEIIVHAIMKLKDISNQQIAKAVAVPPDSWGVTLLERIAVASYLSDRRDMLVDLYL